MISYFNISMNLIMRLTIWLTTIAYTFTSLLFSTIYAPLGSYHNLLTLYILLGYEPKP